MGENRKSLKKEKKRFNGTAEGNREKKRRGKGGGRCLARNRGIRGGMKR